MTVFKTENGKHRKVLTNGCIVTLSFLTESNGEAINKAKKILVSSMSEYKDISSKSA